MKSLRLYLLRLWLRISGNCLRYLPDETGVCQVCRIPPAGLDTRSQKMSAMTPHARFNNKLVKGFIKQARTTLTRRLEEQPIAPIAGDTITVTYTARFE